MEQSLATRSQEILRGNCLADGSLAGADVALSATILIAMENPSRREFLVTVSAATFATAALPGTDLAVAATPASADLWLGEFLHPSQNHRSASRGGAAENRKRDR